MTTTRESVENALRLHLGPYDVPNAKWRPVATTGQYDILTNTGWQDYNLREAAVYCQGLADGRKLMEIAFHQPQGFTKEEKLVAREWLARISANLEVPDAE